MKRLATTLFALVGALVLPSGALASPSSTNPIPIPATTPTAPVHEQVSGTVLSVSGRTFAIQTGGARMSVVAALTDAATNVTAGDFPYVYGGGHAQAGIASIGIPGSGYNGRRIGFDCSGSVAAVLAGAGVWQPTSGVPNDAGIIAGLRQQHLIARGVGQGATEVRSTTTPASTSS